MHDAADGGRRDVVVGEQAVDAGHHAARGVGVGGELLVARLAAGCGIVGDDVREGAADIDAKAETRHDRSPSEKDAAVSPAMAAMYSPANARQTPRPGV